MDTPSIPPKTLEKLNGNAPKGERHKAKLDIALPLIGNGMDPGAVAGILRGKFPDASDKEIQDVVRWAIGKAPTPTQGRGMTPDLTKWSSHPATPKPVPKLTPAEAVRKFMGDVAAGPGDCSAVSPVPIPSEPKEQAALAMRRLYAEAETINVVCRFTQDEDKDKAKPKGGGKSLTPSQWINFIAENGVPQSQAGAWIRPNPCGPGSGADGAITDADITSFRFLLVESDKIPVGNQLAFLIRLKLPVAAIILSGGISAHAWIRLDAADRTDYAAKAARILRMLEPFGFDQANKNPSRLSRLPGAVRAIGAHEDGNQSLLYLDDKCRGADGCSDDALDTLESILRSEFIPPKPMLESVLAAAERVEWLIENQGKIGLKIGIPQFDDVTGGFRRKQMIVLAAESKGGKSALALNIAYFVAVKSAKTVALFTLEMDRDEITDLLFCIHCQIDRNKFNTGLFFHSDTVKISTMTGEIADAPLYVFDEPVMTTEDVRSRCQRLKAERGLSLAIVDYLQLLTPLDSFRDNREQQVASMGRAIRVMAKELDVPVLVLSQINDDGKLRESRAVGHDAHAIMKLLEEDESHSPYDDRDMILRIQRARSMPRGDYQIRFQPLFCRMTGEPSKDMTSSRPF